MCCVYVVGSRIEREKEKKKDVDIHKSHETVCVSNKKTRDATEKRKEGEESDCVCVEGELTRVCALYTHSIVSLSLSLSRSFSRAYFFDDDDDDEKSEQRITQN